MANEVEDVPVSETATRTASGHDGENRTWVKYALQGGWTVEIRGQAGGPVDGPVAVEVNWADTDYEDSSGITADVLRAIPLNDARKVLRRLRSDLLATRDTGVYELPPRMASPEDWVKFARAYARSAVRNPRQPVAHLAQATGLSPNTVAARVRRAQKLGLLVASGTPLEPSTPWLVLGGDALGSEVETDG